MSNDSQDRKDRSYTAIDWWVRLDAGALSHAELLAFRAWLAKDPANDAAFDEVCDLWGDLEKLRPLLPAALTAPTRWPWVLPAAALAAAAIVLFLGFGELSMLWRADFSTGTGDVKIVTLEDGSRVQLNAGTAIAKDFSGGQRRLTLLKGEAWFEVAADPSRPFTVEASGGKTTALGTAFDITTETARTEITVTAHRVAVEDGAARQSGNAGEQTAYGPGLAVLAPYAVDTDSVTAWWRGKLIFQDKPLGEVVAILDHYHRGLKGQHTLDDALGKLLAGTGLAYRLAPNGTTVAIMLAQNDTATPTDAGAIALPTVEVEADLAVVLRRLCKILRRDQWHAPPFPPQIGTQYEGGAKAEFFDGRLVATMAFYDITKSNIVETIPGTPFSRPVGLVESKGAEFDIAGRIDENWSLIGSYSYDDVRITKDAITSNVGHRLQNVPFNAGSIWVKYDAGGDFRGLSLGGGGVVVGERQGDNGNTFQLPAYARVDTAIIYRFQPAALPWAKNLTAQLNVRNLFNTTYYLNSSDRFAIFPGAPRTFLASLRAEF